MAAPQTDPEGARKAPTESQEVPNRGPSEPLAKLRLTEFEAIPSSALLWAPWGP